MARLHFISLATAFCVFYSKTLTEGFPVYSTNVTDLPPLTCCDVQSSEPRVVTILRDGLEVLCDTQTDGGGWLVVQRRVNGAVDFYRNWENYKYGFGDPNGEFWFGNEKMHHLTSERRYEMRVDLKFKSHDYHAVYSYFRLFGEPEGYRLTVTGYSGNAGDCLGRHNSQRFSTYDMDNDATVDDCADSFHGAWWYVDCHDSNLNGLWGSTRHAEGLSWKTLTTHYDTAQFTEIKIRPVY